MKLGFVEIKIHKNYKTTLENVLLGVLCLCLIVFSAIALIMLGFLLLVCSALVLDFTTKIFSSNSVINEIDLLKNIISILVISTCMSVIYYKIGHSIVNFIRNKKNMIIGG